MFDVPYMLLYKLVNISLSFSPQGEQNRDSSRGPHKTEVSHPRMGHEVLPGVFSSVPRGKDF